jgi:hypothetical protein
LSTSWKLLDLLTADCYDQYEHACIGEYAGGLSREADGHVSEQQELALYRPRVPRDASSAGPQFDHGISHATSNLVRSCEPNLACGIAIGLKEQRALDKTSAHVPQGIPVTVKAQKGNTAPCSEAFAILLWETLHCDAATSNAICAGMLQLRNWPCRQGDIHLVKDIKPRFWQLSGVASF